MAVLDDARLTRFREAARGLKAEPTIVVTQIDPDAMGSAVAMSYLLEAAVNGCAPRVFFCGAIAHPQNRAIVNKYNLRSRLSPIDDLKGQKPDNCVLVDSSLGEDGRLPRGLVLEPRIVLDHHRGSDLVERDGQWFWIEDVGSTCTLVTELWRALGLEFRGERQFVATLLALGIYTDTKALVSASPRDRDAYGYVAQFVTPQELQQLIDYDLPESHFRNLARALSRYEHRGPRLVAGCGSIAAEDGDDLSTIADYFLRMEGITLVVVWGIVGESVRISARNANLSAPLDDFLKRRFGPTSGAKLTPDGKGEGGARLRLDLGIWLSEGTRAEVEGMVGARIRELIFQD